MGDYEIDWSKRGKDLTAEIERYRHHTILANIRKLDELARQLDERDVFDHKNFRSVRRRTGTQQQWADLVGVSAQSIGNYERNATSPNKATRAFIRKAIAEIRARESEKLSGAGRTDVDPVNAKNALDQSILSAALTDFSFDRRIQKVRAVPFKEDVRQNEIAAIEEDRKNLLGSLAASAHQLAEDLAGGANLNTERIIRTLRSYSAEVLKAAPNPRLLFRSGTNISRAFANEYFVQGVNEFDRVAVEGFLDDHNELMRLYYREALAKAQLVDAAAVPDDAELPSAAEFSEIARIIDEVVDEEGNRIFDEAIPTLIRDIARDIDENLTAEILLDDPQRKMALRRRRVEAIKNGSILVGRFLFVTSFFIAVDPAVAFTALTGVATIVGSVEQVAPGSVRRYYERLREALPFLPKFPSRD